MDTKDVLVALRKKHKLTQEQMAERLFVTRQAISRWETGETTPGLDALKLLSKTFDVSINTLLGAPRKLICQCCGMPLDDDSISRETDGLFNEDFCKWCYADGQFVYESLDVLVDYLADHVPVGSLSRDEKKGFFQRQLKNLSYWKDK